MENDMKKCFVIVIDKQYTSTIFGKKVFKDKTSALREVEKLKSQGKLKEGKTIDGFEKTIKVVQDDIKYIESVI
tara:strand:- start:4036 stop:4257 length:222 start_codon:yes stop_codon:yes gene_type:complete